MSNKFADEDYKKPTFESISVYRYIPSFRLEDCLTNGMYLPTPDKFEDRREGILPFEACLNEDRMGKIYWPESSSTELQQLREHSEYFVEQSKAMYSHLLVSCWYSDPSENFLMWKAYGGSKLSLRIEVNFVRLLEIFSNYVQQNDGLIHVESNLVRYLTPIQAFRLDHSDEIFGRYGSDLILAAEQADEALYRGLVSGFFYKHVGFRDEKEFRFVVVADRIPDPPKILINSAISRVTCSPYATDQDFDEMQKMVERHLPNVDFARSYLEPR